MANNIANQTKNAQVNSFTGGINTDLHPMLQPNNTLTDCVNGTLITYNGNENMLQNDMGNYALEGAKLPTNYVPIGVKEHAGILYVVAYNPLTKRTQIGSYPSPKVTFENPKEGAATVKIKPYKIKSISDSDGSFDPFEIMESEEFTVDNQDGYHLYSNVIKTADGLLHLLGEMSQDEYQLTINDQYKIGININDEPVNFESYTDPWMQELKFYSVTKDGKIEDISDKIYNVETKGYFNNVTWESAGWVGVKYELADILKGTQTITNVIYPTISSSKQSVWNRSMEGEYPSVVGSFTDDVSFYEDPYVVIDEESGPKKYYWKDIIPDTKNTVLYYSKNDWVVKDPTNCSITKNKQWTTVVFKDSIEILDIAQLFEPYDHSDPIYIFLSKEMYCKEGDPDSGEERLFRDNTTYVYIHEDSENSFTFGSLKFVNIPEKAHVYLCGGVRELYCPNDSAVSFLEGDVVGMVGCFIGTPNNYRREIKEFPVIVSEDLTTGLYPVVSEESNSLLYTTVNGDKCIPSGFDDGGIVSNEFDEIGTINFNDVTSIPNESFKNTKLTSIWLPKYITSIGENAFNTCKYLTHVRLSPDTTSINEEAFHQSGLMEIELPNSVNTITRYSFAKTSLTSITIPDSVTSIGERAFSECEFLKTIIIGKTVSTVGDYAFYKEINSNTPLNVYCKASNPPTLGLAVFGWNKDLLKIYVSSDKVETYKTSWTDYADNIFAYDFDNSVIELNETPNDDEIWYETTNRELLDIDTLRFPTIINHSYDGGVGKIQFSESLTRLENWYIFQGATTLKRIIFPKQLVYLGGSAFSGCTNLKHISFTGNPLGFNAYTFDGLEYIPVLIDPEYEFDFRIKYTNVNGYSEHTKVYVTGSSDEKYVDDFGKIKVYTNQDLIKYCFPEGWTNRSVNNNFSWEYFDTYSVGNKNDLQMVSTLLKYCYDTLSVVDQIPGLLGWLIDNNTITLYFQSIDEIPSSATVQINANAFGTWYYRTDKIFESVSNHSSKYNWLDSNNNPKNSIESADLMKFSVNFEYRVPRNIWESYIDDPTQIKVASRITGIEGENRYICTDVFTQNESATDFTKETILSINKKPTYFTLSTNFNFAENIPTDFEALQVESILYCVKNSQVLLFDHSYKQSELLIPEIKTPDYSESNVCEMSYTVDVNDNNKHDLEINVGFTKAVSGSDITVKLVDSNGDFVYYGTSTSGYALNHTCCLYNCDLKMQFAQLYVYVDSDLKYNKKIMVNSVVNTHQTTDMGNLSWDKLIDEIIKINNNSDDEINEWNLNVEIEIDHENVTTVPCAYKLNDNGEMVDIQKWTKDTIPANVIPIVDEDGFIPGYEGQTFADLVYAPVKIIVTLGHGVKIEGDVYLHYGEYLNGEKYINSEKADNIPISINNIILGKNIESSVNGVPVHQRSSKYLYKPVGLDSWIKMANVESYSDLLNKYWEENNKCLCAKVLDSSVEYSLSEPTTFDATHNTRPLKQWCSDDMPAIFPIKYTNDTDWRGVNVPQLYTNDSITLYANQKKKQSYTTTDGDEYMYKNAKVKNTIFSLVYKDSFYTFCINGENGPKYPWFKNTVRYTKEEFLDLEKKLFLLAIMCDNIKTLQIENSKNAFNAVWELNQNVSTNIKFSLYDVHCGIADKQFRIQNICDINAKCDSINCENLSSIQEHLQDLQSIFILDDIHNEWIDLFKNTVNKSKISEPNYSDFPEQSLVWAKGWENASYGPIMVGSSPFIRHDNGSTPVSTDLSRSEKLMVEDDPDYYEFWKEGFIPKEDKEKYFHDRYAPWTLTCEYDFFNQTSQTFDDSGYVTIEIDGQEYTKTIDEWLIIYLQKLVKELKYERDYNNTLK